MDLRKYEPLPHGHPAIGLLCLLCNRPFVEGDETTLIPVEPADDIERIKMQAGEPYIAQAEIAHWECANLLDAIQI